MTSKYHWRNSLGTNLEGVEGWKEGG